MPVKVKLKNGCENQVFIKYVFLVLNVGFLMFYLKKNSYCRINIFNYFESI